MRYNTTFKLLAGMSFKLAWKTGNTGNGNLMEILCGMLNWASWDSESCTNRPLSRNTHTVLTLQAVDML